MAFITSITVIRKKPKEDAAAKQTRMGEASKPVIDVPKTFPEQLRGLGHRMQFWRKTESVAVETAVTKEERVPVQQLEEKLEAAHKRVESSAWKWGIFGAAILAVADSPVLGSLLVGISIGRMKGAEDVKKNASSEIKKSELEKNLTEAEKEVFENLTKRSTFHKISDRFASWRAGEKLNEPVLEFNKKGEAEGEIKHTAKEIKTSLEQLDKILESAWSKTTYNGLMWACAGLSMSFGIVGGIVMAYQANPLYSISQYGTLAFGFFMLSLGVMGYGAGKVLGTLEAAREARSVVKSPVPQIEKPIAPKITAA